MDALRLAMLNSNDDNDCGSGEDDSRGTHMLAASHNSYGIAWSVVLAVSASRWHSDDRSGAPANLFADCARNSTGG